MADETLLQRTQLPRPDVTAEEAAAILDTFYGLKGTITELGSQQDRNYRLDTGESRYVLKICRMEYATVELEAQNAAMHHLATKPDSPRVPTPVKAGNGDDILFLAVGGDEYQVRLLTYLDGEPLTQRKYLGETAVAVLGALTARIAVNLADFEHPGLERELQWDLRRAGQVALHLLQAITDMQARDRIAKAMVAAVRRIQPLAEELRIQAIHHDVTDDNVVSRPDEAGRLIPDGVIDFGDILNGWLAADLAVTCSALLHHADGNPFFILPAIRAYHAVNPLNAAEARALWPLIVARACILVASSEQQLAVEPDNDYVLGNIEHERTIFEVATSVQSVVMEQAILAALDMADPAQDLPPIGPLLPGVGTDAIRLLSLDIDSPHFEQDNFLRRGMELKLLEQAARETGIAITRYGEYRLTETNLRSTAEPETFALHVDLCLPAGFQTAAPFAGRIERYNERTVLAGEGIHLHLLGLDCLHEAGITLSEGEPLGTVEGTAGHFGLMRLQLCTEAGLFPPYFCRPSQADLWRKLSPSPSALLGSHCDAPALDGDDLLARRTRHFAKPQKNYYSNPPQIERGWKEHMFSTTGRAYLDMVNNVSIVGHGHPRLAEAVYRQWSMLNTNSRFHYRAVAEFSERLASLAPEKLDTVFLVNSGSEANDLAIRLAWAASGAKNMVCLLEGYHGWAVGSDAVSTSVADNPKALSTRPDWVHPIMSPNTYRGLYRGENSARDYIAAAMPLFEEVDRKGETLAGFICETVYGNAGGIPLPPGYLKDIYAEVRARGGVCIADEVQVGYGRLGHYFWGFDQQGVEPDIITIAKGMGNGHPLGAVITSKAIAEALEREGGYFFSSAGGSPVSCTVGMTVLDIMTDEELQENARDIGDHLKARLEALGQRFSLVGAVHGMGLYLGVEFVRDRQTLQPATQETAAICDRLLDLGVIMQPTGDYLNVLKIKPPLCLSRESADFFADSLARVLEEGW